MDPDESIALVISPPPEGKAIRRMEPVGVVIEDPASFLDREVRSPGIIFKASDRLSQGGLDLFSHHLIV